MVTSCTPFSELGWLRVPIALVNQLMRHLVLVPIWTRPNESAWSNPLHSISSLGSPVFGLGKFPKWHPEVWTKYFRLVIPGADEISGWVNIGTIDFLTNRQANPDGSSPKTL
uniref:Uncharacterized protein n=1 Tax=Opuntia streptacantha TaxID=393608 RepID=A0A7C9CWX8_OPUST